MKLRIFKESMTKPVKPVFFKLKEEGNTVKLNAVNEEGGFEAELITFKENGTYAVTSAYDALKSGHCDTSFANWGSAGQLVPDTLKAFRDETAGKGKYFPEPVKLRLVEGEDCDIILRAVGERGEYVSNLIGFGPDNTAAFPGALMKIREKGYDSTFANWKKSGEILI